MEGNINITRSSYMFITFRCIHKGTIYSYIYIYITIIYIIYILYYMLYIYDNQAITVKTSYNLDPGVKHFMSIRDEER